METQTPSAQPAAQARPGLKLGQVSEFTLILPLKPGGADRMRERMKTYMSGQSSFLDKVGTVHDLRFVIFDNDTRIIFASTFDGDWDAYIDDFGNTIPDEIDLLFHEFEGYPGINSAEIKDWIVKQQVTA